MLFGAAWSDPATGKTADWGTLLLAWSWQNIFVLCCSAPQFSIILGAGEGNLSLGWRSQEGGLEHMLSEMRMGMADVRPKFVLVGSQGTTCSICSWLPVTQAAMNSVLLSAIYPLGQEIPFSGEQNERDKTGGKKKRYLCFTLAWMRNEACWRDTRVFLVVCSESWGYDPSQKQQQCSWKLWGSCSGEMTFPRQQWVPRSLSECITCVHIPCLLQGKPVSIHFQQESSVFDKKKKNSPSSLSPLSTAQLPNHLPGCSGLNWSKFHLKPLQIAFSLFFLKAQTPTVHG